MRAEDVRAFMRRDWAAVAEAKEAAWLDVRRVQGVAGVLRLADALRAHARQVRPDWPSADDRAEDLATHERVSEALRRAGRVGGG